MLAIVPLAMFPNNYLPNSISNIAHRCVFYIRNEIGNVKNSKRKNSLHLLITLDYLEFMESGTHFLIMLFT